jgi:tRNA (5-methylaminomethyl-2-thiouridylate)-methyltransferase (EC 2.1.1.61)
LGFDWYSSREREHEGLKIAVLMSGGVDSTVSALLLKEAGHRILGLTMIGWDEQAAQKAAAAARGLGIEHRVVDLRDVFQEKVVDYFCRSYERGETPQSLCGMQPLG